MKSLKMPWRDWLPPVAGAALITYATHPLVTAFVILQDDQLSSGFLTACLAGIFALILVWRLKCHPGKRGFERAVLASAWLFLLAIPLLITAGLLAPDGRDAGALVFFALIFGGSYVIQSVFLFIWAKALRKSRDERERLAAYRQ